MIWRYQTKIRDKHQNPKYDVNIWVFIIIPVYISIKSKTYL